LEGISTFELQITTIANFKPYGLLDSSTHGSDGAIFCFQTSKSAPIFFNLLPLDIITLNILKTTKSLLIVIKNSSSTS